MVLWVLSLRGLSCWLEVNERALLIGWNIASEGRNQCVPSQVWAGKGYISLLLGSFLSRRWEAPQAGELRMASKALSSVLAADLPRACFSVGNAECAFPFTPHAQRTCSHRQPPLQGCPRWDEPRPGKPLLHEFEKEKSHQNSPKPSLLPGLSSLRYP